MFIVEMYSKALGGKKGHLIPTGMAAIKKPNKPRDSLKIRTFLITQEKTFLATW